MKPINRELYRHVQRLRNENDPLPPPELKWTRGDTIILWVIILGFTYVAIRWLT